MILRTLALLGALAAPLLFCGPASAQGFSLSPTPMQRFTDNNGNSCSGCKVFTYAAGTTSKLATYTDASGATPQTNPIILNTRGEAPIWLSAAVYKFVLSPPTDTDPPTNPTWTVDNINRASAVNQCRNITDFGGVGDNATDNFVPFNNAVQQLQISSANVCISFGSGIFKFSSAPTVTLPNSVASLTVLGIAPDATQLYFPTTSGFTVNISTSDNSVHFRNFAMTTGVAGATSNAIGVTLAGSGTNNFATANFSDFTNIVFRGSSTANTDPARYWQYAISATAVNNINFDSVAISGAAPYQSTLPATGGNGVILQGNVSTNYAVVFNFAKCTFNSLINGLLLGAGVQGVTVTQSNFTGGYTGIGVPAGQNGVDELIVSGGNQINAGGYGINLLSPVPNVGVSSNLFITGFTGSVAANVTAPALGSASSLVNFIGNFINTGSHGQLGTGFQMAPGSVGGVFIGNSINQQAVAIALNGIGARVQSNVYSNNTTNVTSVSSSNTITGLPLVFGTVIGAVDNGSGMVRLTISPNTNAFVNGEQVIVSGVGGLVPIATSTLTSPITVVDGTHIDLATVQFIGGPYTSGGSVATLP